MMAFEGNVKTGFVFAWLSRTWAKLPQEFLFSNCLPQAPPEAFSNQPRSPLRACSIQNCGLGHEDVEAHLIRKILLVCQLL
jgi:hypothetical protein